VKIEQLQNSIAESKRTTEYLKQDKNSFAPEIEEVRNNTVKLDNSIRDLNLAIGNLEEKHGKYKKNLESAREYEKEIVEKLAFHINLESAMAEELLKYRSIAAEARSSYQKFEVRRIWMLMTTNVSLVLKKGVDGKHVLQINDGKKVTTYKIADVDELFMHPVKTNRFILRTCAGETQEYESEQASKIMALIRELIFSDFNERD
jgi:hypothetical protein